MRVLSNFLIVGFAVTLTFGCSYRGKGCSSQFKDHSDFCPSCSECAFSAGLLTAGVARVSQIENASLQIEAEPGNQLPPSVGQKNNYQINEVVPYSATQLKIESKKSVLSDSESSRVPNLNGRIEPCTGERKSDSPEGFVEVPAAILPAHPQPEKPVAIELLEKPIVLHARPNLRGALSDSTRKNVSTLKNRPKPNSSPPNPSQARVEMEPVNSNALSDAQPVDLGEYPSGQSCQSRRANLDAPMPRDVFRPVAPNRTAMPMMQISSKRAVGATPPADAATRLLQQNSVDSRIGDRPADILRLRATTGHSSDPPFPPIVRLNMKPPTGIRSLEVNQLDSSEPNQFRLLPPMIDESSPPALEDAPMIDDSRVNESIRRLTVRPRPESPSDSETIDR